jgi:hypothetical protein
MFNINPLDIMIAYINPKDFKYLTTKQKLMYPILTPIFLLIIGFFVCRWLYWLFLDRLKDWMQRVIRFIR